MEGNQMPSPAFHWCFIASLVNAEITTKSLSRLMVIHLRPWRRVIENKHSN